jgi:hypothetical protein
MDMKRIRELAGLQENMSPTLQGIAEEVYTLAESRVADTAAGQDGRGFDRTAIMHDVDKIFIEIKAHIEYKLRNNKF